MKQVLRRIKTISGFVNLEKKTYITGGILCQAKSQLYRIKARIKSDIIKLSRCLKYNIY